MKVMKYDVPSGYRCVLVTLLGIMFKHRKHYCWVSQKRLLELMDEKGGVKIWRSTLNLWLKWLELNGWIRRYPGKPRLICGELVNRATRYYLLPKAIRLLKQLKFCVEKVFQVLGVRFKRQDKATPGEVYSDLRSVHVSREVSLDKVCPIMALMPDV